jgi:hypothetical protein
MLYYETLWFRVLLISFLIMSLATAYICYRKAKKMNLNAWLWPVLGYLFPVVTVFAMNLFRNKS